MVMDYGTRRLLQLALLLSLLRDCVTMRRMLVKNFVVIKMEMY
jgi:hypothetical protein